MRSAGPARFAEDTTRGCRAARRVRLHRHLWATVESDSSCGALQTHDFCSRKRAASASRFPTMRVAANDFVSSVVNSTTPEATTRTAAPIRSRRPMRCLAPDLSVEFRGATGFARSVTDSATMLSRACSCRSFRQGRFPHERFRHSRPKRRLSQACHGFCESTTRSGPGRPPNEVPFGGARRAPAATPASAVASPSSGAGLYLLGSYRIATAPEPSSSRPTNLRSTYFDRPANNVGP